MRGRCPDQGQRSYVDAIIVLAHSLDILHFSFLVETDDERIMGY